MLGVNVNRNVFYSQYAPEFIRNLHGKAFLNLRPPGEMLNNAVQFGEPDHFPVGNVCNVGFSINRKKVVFAKRIKGNVPLYKHAPVLVFVFKKRNFGVIGRIKTAKNFFNKHFSNPLWGSLKRIIGHV